MQTPRFGLIFPWLFFSAFVLVIFGWMASGSEIALANQLEAKGLKAQGTVYSATNGDSLNSPYIYYKFDLDGKLTYGHSHIQPKDKGRYGPGSEITLLYLPNDPTKSAVDLQGLRESGWRGLKFAAVIEAVVTIFFGAAAFGGSGVQVRRPGFGRTGSSQGNPIAALIIIVLMSTMGLAMLFFAAIPEYQKSEKLVNTGMPITAQITGVYTKSKSNKRYAEYSFDLNGQFFHGSADYQGAYSDRGPIQVWYLPSDPSFSAINPTAKMKNSQYAIVFMVIWNLLVGGIGGFVFLKARATRGY